MSTELEINQTIRNIINTVAGIDGYAIKARQTGAVKPAGGFATVDVIAIAQTGTVDRISVGCTSTDMQIDNIIRQEVTVSCRFFRDNALDNAVKVKAGMSNISTLSTLRQASLGYIDCSSARHIPNTTDTGWEDSVSLDIRLNADTTITESVALINSLDVNMDNSKTISTVQVQSITQ